VSAEVHAEIVRLYTGGKTLQQAAELCGRSATIAGRAVSRAGVMRPKGPRPGRGFNLKRLAEAVRVSDMPIGELARALGVSRHTLWEAARKHGTLRRRQTHA